MRAIRWSAVMLCFVLFASVIHAQPSVPCSPCAAADNGFGTANFPAPCSYTPCCGQTMQIVNGLPFGSTIEIHASLENFSGIVSVPGGPLLGETVTANAQLKMNLNGTGALVGFSRNIVMPVQVQFQNAPRTAFEIVQPFDGYLDEHFGQIFGDPDFDLLRIVAGTNFGMPSPGHTTFSQQTPGWSSESFFDIEYRIDFVGAPGGSLAGMSGSTNRNIRFYQGCPRWVPGDSHKMHFAQHPDETGWDVSATWPRRLSDDWSCSETGPVKDLHFWGSFINGQAEKIDRFYLEIYTDVPAGFDLPYSHPGTLLWADTVTDYVMTPITPGLFEGWYDPYFPFFVFANHNEYWQYDVLLKPPKWFNQTFGTIYWLSISAQLADTSAGQRWGWKSTQNHFNDDAVYRTLTPAAICIAPDNGFGTATQVATCPFDNNDLFYISSGLPPATTIECNAIMHSISGVVETPGGGLGGTQSQFNSQLQLRMNGTGAFLGYARIVNIPLPLNTVHTAPRVPFASPQIFPTDYFEMQGQIVGDPDFDLLRITAGTTFGMPSPGQTNLTQVGPQWGVGSFFDISYRIDFVGNPGGPFAGMSGSTTGIARIRQGTPFIPSVPWIEMYEPPAFTQSLDLSFVITGSSTSCCIGTRGNIDCDVLHSVDIADLTVLVDHLFISFPPLCCPDEADVLVDSSIDIADLTVLVDHLFISFAPLPACI